MRSVSIPIHLKKLIFQWRVHMAPFKNNYRAGRQVIQCPLCNSHPDCQESSFSCTFITNETQIRGNYKELFEDVSERPNLITTISNITKIRSKIVGDQQQIWTSKKNCCCTAHVNPDLTLQKSDDWMVGKRLRVLRKILGYYLPCIFWYGIKLTN